MTSSPPTESVPPVGVSVSVCPFSQANAPATVVKVARALEGVPPLITFSVPDTLNCDPAATAVIPCPPPVRFSVAPPLMSTLPLLVSELILTTSPALANDRKAPALLVNIPLIVALLLLEVWNVPVLFRLLTKNVETFPMNSCPPTASVPPVGVSVSACPFSQANAPATVVKFARALEGVPPLITFSVPDTLNCDPAATAALPCPPPVRVSVAPPLMSTLPLLVSELILTTSPALANDRKAPALLVNIPLIVALLLLEVWNVRVLFRLLTKNVEPFPMNSCPPTESVPPVGVSVSVCPFSQANAPATVVKFARALDGGHTLITLRRPERLH